MQCAVLGLVGLSAVTAQGAAGGGGALHQAPVLPPVLPMGSCSCPTPQVHKQQVTDDPWRGCSGSCRVRCWRS